jgi:tetratricopeptide (TPR) repeat protein
VLNWFKKLFSKPFPVLADEEEPEKPRDARVHELIQLGDKMFTAEDYIGARSGYESALRVDGHDAEVWQRRGKLFLHLNEILPAAACFVRSLELSTKIAEAWSGLGSAILAYHQANPDPTFMRDNQVEIISEAAQCFIRAKTLNPDLDEIKSGLEACRSILRESFQKISNPPIFSFHSGGILEKTKREVISPFLKPGDYRRKAPLTF